MPQNLATDLLMAVLIGLMILSIVLPIGLELQRGGLKLWKVALFFAVFFGVIVCLSSTLNSMASNATP